jgi:hypothetical protein
MGMAVIVVTTEFCIWIMTHHHGMSDVVDQDGNEDDPNVLARTHLTAFGGNLRYAWTRNCEMSNCWR